VLLLEDVADVPDSFALARRLVAALAEPIPLPGRAVQITASIGIAMQPDQGASDKLMIQADAAMTMAKRAGGNGCALFDADMEAGASQPARPAVRAAPCAAAGQLSLHYQPKFDSQRGRLRGVEALLRWQHPERGAIGPAVFIPMAERSGLINELGNWVIDEACRQMKDWEAQGVRMRVAINLSVHQLASPTCRNASNRRSAATRSRPRSCCARSPNRSRCRTSRPPSAPSTASAASACSCPSTTSAPAIPASATCASCRHAS
jgi:predicted signal transduction protein with EAL and GGDEF domain